MVSITHCVVFLSLFLFSSCVLFVILWIVKFWLPLLIIATWTMCLFRRKASMIYNYDSCTRPLQQNHRQVSLENLITCSQLLIRVITKLSNSEQSNKGKVKTHKYINRQNQSTTGKLWKPYWPWLGTGISKEMVGWIRFYLAF